MIEHNAASVLIPYLIFRGVASNPGTTNPWPVYVNLMPEQPNEALCVFDTIGEVHGREMRGGKWLEKPGIQIMIRATSNANGTNKGLKIINALEQLYMYNVTLQSPTKQYQIHSFKRTSPTYPLGQEEGGSRLLYTINGLLTYGEI